jgi:uncharacterized protein DUF6526
MPNDAPQNLKNHARFVPLFHFVAFPILVANLVWTIMRMFSRPSGETAMAALLAVGLLLLAWYARTFALTVQNRVIRLEMRLRLREVLPADLVQRIHEFTPRQLVALRFASDRELPALARQVLDQRLDDGRAIKQLVKEWQADHLRA